MAFNFKSSVPTASDPLLHVMVNRAMRQNVPPVPKPAHFAKPGNLAPAKGAKFGAGKKVPNYAESQTHDPAIPFPGSE